MCFKFPKGKECSVYLFVKKTPPNNDKFDKIQEPFLFVNFIYRLSTPLVIITSEGLRYLDICSGFFFAVEQDRIFIVSRLLCQVASGCMVSPGGQPCVT